MIGETILHYKILEKLGEGGMGVVYLAEDLSLERKVAIKFLPRHISVNPEEKERFKIEAKASAALNHPNVGHIYAIEEKDDEMFIVMEFIDGKELKSLMETGQAPSLQVKDVINYAVQIAEGLEAAHKKGIVHRDIKSQNIMVTTDAKIKIMDFGLAKVKGGSQITKTGMTIGTIAYMSPEQARGEKVDHRTDIWSFGILLYEMCTGKLPFKGDYEIATIYSILNDEPDQTPVTQKQLPAWLINIINKCLKKNPEERYQSFSEILLDLKGIQDSKKEEKREINKPILEKIYKRKPVLIGAGVVILIMFFLFSYEKDFFSSIFSSSKISSEQHLLILPINNIGDPTKQAFCDGLVETLSSNLTQIEQFQGSLWVVPASEVIQNNIKSASEARRMFGVNLVVSGSIQFLNNLVRLTLNLVDAENLRQLNSSVIDIMSKDISSTQNKAVIKLMEMLHIEMAPELKDILNAGKTSVPEAYEYYVQGRGNLQRYEDLENVEEAINLFKLASERDTNYALAYAGLGEAYWRNYEITKNSQIVSLAIKEAKKGYKIDSLLAPVNVTLGMIYSGTGNYNNAIVHFKLALAKDRSDAAALRGLAKAYESAENNSEAELTYKRAIKLKPDYWAGYNDLGVYYYRNSRYEDAIKQFKEVIKLTPDNYRGYNNLGGIFYLLERWPEAREMFESSLQIRKSYNIYSNLGTLYYIENKYDDAAQMYEEALKINDNDYLIWGNLAAAYSLIPAKNKDAVANYNRAINLAEDKLKINPNDYEVTSNLASYYADVGDTSKALALLKESISSDPENVMIMYRAATIYEHLGNREEALFWIGKAIENGYSRSEIEHQPELKNLISDKRYSILLSKK